MGSAIVLGRDLDVLVLLAVVLIAIFDSEIGEVDAFIEVGQVVLARPFTDLFTGPIGGAVTVGAAAIALVQPGLVFTLELVVEANPLDVCAAVRQALRGAFVGSVDLDVVSELALTFNAMPEGLPGIPVATAALFEQVSSVSRQGDGMLARSGDANRLDQPLLAQVPQVARPGIKRTVVMVSEITTGDHAEGADGRQRARL